MTDTTIATSAQKSAAKLGSTYAAAIVKADAVHGAAVAKAAVEMLRGLQSGLQRLNNDAGAGRVFVALVKSALVTGLTEAGRAEKTAQNKASILNSAERLIRAGVDVAALVAGCASESGIIATLKQAMADAGLNTGRNAPKPKAGDAPTDADAAQLDSNGRPFPSQKDAPKGTPVADAPTPAAAIDAAGLALAMMGAKPAKSADEKARDAVADAVTAIKLVANLLAVTGAPSDVQDAWTDVLDHIERARADIKKALRAK